MQLVHIMHLTPVQAGAIKSFKNILKLFQERKGKLEEVVTV